LQQSYSAAFIEGIQHAELLNNAIMALIAPELYDVGLSAIIKTMDGIEMAKHYENVHLWPSIFTGIKVIVNRLTPLHRDKGGCPSHMDLLVLCLAVGMILVIGCTQIVPIGPALQNTKHEIGHAFSMHDSQP
jgi:hypothetical protein